MRRIDIDDPDVDIDYGHRLLYCDEPFTGEAVEYLSGHLVSQVMYTEGIKDGSFREWYKDGTLRAEGVMRVGLVSGEFKRWHPNGVLAKRVINSEDGKTPLAEFEWDEEGLPTRSWRQPE
ncbi:MULTISPECIES: toxin-antitoxin system YwqK family antitoxin [Streptomyces]|uniref:toxin-antitoxin system YwqK family antitoxin n=1 Tax=Streptomyces TaxID=1883 RepID=UPI000F6567B9|nr:hypothetical protein [Streptomyces alboflavus]